MDSSENRCKDCGVVFEDVDGNIDKCVKKRLYCELCLAQKNPRSETERKIRIRYTLITATAALLLLIIFFALNWDQNKNNSFFDYLVAFGFGYLIIWCFASILLLPALMMMKKPHKDRINKEKEEYIGKIEEKKQTRNKQRMQQ